jgi:hypothetical protein
MSSPASARRESPDDVGTLWTLRRSGYRARCALMALVGDWELRVIVEGTIIHAERCRRGAEAFAVADAWKRRMLDQGWHQVVPPAAPDPAFPQGGRDETGLTPFPATRFV